MLDGCRSFCACGLLVAGVFLAAPPARAQSAATLVPGESWISELRVGVFDHDIGILSRARESGIDGNLEVLFTSPDNSLFGFFFSPRPHIGITVNSDGNTSEAYAGLTWEIGAGSPLFFNFSIGGAIHSGKLDTDDPDRKALGARALFRESVELGYRFAERQSLSLYLSHISNAWLADPNEGLENVGIRYGYRF
jgi:lipid A 3-O-deacylase